MKQILDACIFILSLVSCRKKHENGMAAITPSTDSMQLSDSLKRTYLALGDSYTIGTAVSPEESFPAQVTELLKKENVAIDRPEIIAVNGWATINLADALLTKPPGNDPYTFVTLLIGVNNQYQRRPLDEYKSDFVALLSKAISYAGDVKSHVFVLSIPDYSVTPFASGSDTAKISRELDAFNEANKVISLAAGVQYVDITDISREAKSDRSLLAPDGLHPSGSQYARWSEKLLPLMLAEIR